VQARKPTPQHDWTDANQGDPGLPLLELLAYVLDEVGFYLDRIADETRLRRRRRDVVLAGAAALVFLEWWRRRSNRDDD
jgi:hypothetical protein